MRPERSRGGPGRAVEVELSFTNARGMQLAASLEIPSGTDRPPVVIFAHGLGSSRRSARNRAIAELLKEAGIAALLFDFTGHGQSEGVIDDATVSRMAEDLQGAIDFVSRREDMDATRIGVNGSSSGAIVAVLVGSREPRVKAMVLRSAPAEGLLGAASDIRVPTLVIGGERDTPAVYQDRALANAISGKHRFIEIPEAEFLFEGPHQTEQVAELSASWFIEHLVTNPATVRTPEERTWWPH
jgi:pimeloyl-ACP methyl ester carboxylesterase